MPTRNQALSSYQQHGDYRAAGQQLGVPAGQAYLIATGRPADGGNTCDTDILFVLSRQHDQVTELIKQIKRIPGVTKGGSVVHQSRRASIADMITVALSKHEAAEEEHFWPWVRSVLDDALIADTAVPAWHDGYRYMPFVFAASAASAAAGLGLAGAPLHENEPVLRLGVLGGVAELALEKVMEKRMGLPGEAYEEGRAKRYTRIAQALTAGGVLTAGLLGSRSRAAAAVAGAALLAGSALTRFAIFQAGLTSAEDPRYTVVPQRERLTMRATAQG